MISIQHCSLLSSKPLLLLLLSSLLTHKLACTTLSARKLSSLSSFLAETVNTQKVWSLEELSIQHKHRIQVFRTKIRYVYVFFLNDLLL